MRAVLSGTCFTESFSRVQEPVHNIQASVFRALLARQVADSARQKELDAAAFAAVERGEAGAPSAFWYRFAGAQGGASVSDLRARCVESQY